MKDDDCKHEEAKPLTQEDKEYIRDAAPGAIESWKDSQALRNKKRLEVFIRTKKLIQKACDEGKEITPEIEQKIIDQVYKEFGI